MNSLEKMILEEISSLDELRLIDVLGFIRYLKMEKHGAPVEVSAWFDHALDSIHLHTQELGVAEEAIKATLNGKEK